MSSASHEQPNLPGDRLLEQVYDQLRAAAQREMNGERAGHTLSATALVHEAYIRLGGPREKPWQDRAHFYTAAAEAMKRILIDHARARGRKKRSAAVNAADLDAAASLPAPEQDSIDFIALDDAIRRLESNDPRAGQVVRLRFFAGLPIEETAEILGVSKRTVENDWTFAKAWLGRELDGDGGQSEPFAKGG